MKKHPCASCIYFGKSTETCDFILIEGHSRPCPPGIGCSAKRTKKEVKHVKRVKWDVELGRLLWLDGQKDSEIADHFGIAVSTVTSYRKKHWEKLSMESKPEPDPTADEETEYAMEKDMIPVITETSDEPKPIRFDTPANVYEILEAATRNLSGINAICTADAILCLWNWNSADDLRRARAAINHLLIKLEG